MREHISRALYILMILSLCACSIDVNQPQVVDTPSNDSGLASALTPSNPSGLAG